ncbi:homoserine kinase [Virgibacillus sp. W0181]|uniref:homoserine kinase n=1 Tax=Virgibacillus sp. W0181 TaxID=3391581 RepID=UPI003F471E2A
MSHFMISVPASSANIGPGFDSAGIAVSHYLKLHVIEQEFLWEFQHQSPILPPNPIATEHYIYQVAKKVADWYDKTLPPCKVIAESEIPLARGLGSSASAIIAGIELANQMLELNLSTEEKLQYAVDIEGHPDNVAPCLFGGFVITVMIGDEVKYKKLPAIDTDLVIYIPNYEVKTEDARKVLPESFSIKDATRASGISNLMIAALMSKDYELAGQMMEKDMFHEQYRAKLIPEYNQIKQAAREMGAYGTVISGSGPTMISFVPKGKGDFIAKQMKENHATLEIKALALDQVGLQVKSLDEA